MSEIHFQKYRMEQVLEIRKITSADYLLNMSSYETPPHRHDAWEFVICLEGSVLTVQDEIRNTLTRNCFILHTPKRPHHLKIGAGKATLFVLSFTCSSEYLKLLQNKVLHISRKQRNQALMIVRELQEAFELQNGQLLLADFHRNDNAPLGCEQMITGYTEGLLISLLRVVTENSRSIRADEILTDAMENRIARDVCDYIDCHIGEKLTLDTISDRLHYSRSYITQQFRASTGQSIQEYISRRRIEEAQKMLLRGSPSAEVAEALGYSSVQYFSKCFKDTVGLPPARFAKNISLAVPASAADA